MARKSSRAAQGAGTIRRKTVTRNGKQYTYWETRVTIGRDPGTGKQLQKSFTGKTQKEVREKMQAASAELNNGTYLEPTKMTVAEWLDIWESEYLGPLAAGTRSSYRTIIKTHIKPALGAIKLSSLNTHTIQTFYNSLGKGSEKCAKLAPTTIRGVHAVLSSALTQAVKVEYIKANPAENCILPKKEKREMTALDEDQAKLFLQAIEGHRYGVLFTVALFTGMRQGELLGLTWDSVDFENGVITVDKQLQCNRMENNQRKFTRPKWGSKRKITPAPRVMQILKRHHAKQIEARLRAGPMWQDYNLVFTNGEGRYLLPETVNRNLKVIAREIGCPNLRFHDLRHSYAIASIQAGDDIKTLQENLGHASATMTLDVYAHVTEQMKQTSAEHMDGYIKDVLGL